MALRRRDSRSAGRGQRRSPHWAFDQTEVAERIGIHWTRVATKFDHHGVVRVNESGHDPQAGAYVIMDYVSGEPLSLVLAREGRISPARTMEIVAQVANALAAVHDWGVVHRGLRPGRVLVRQDGKVMLAAFSLERYVRPFDGSMVELDHPHYLAPEQAMGNRASRTDRHLRAGRDCLRVPDRSAALRRRESTGGRVPHRPRGTTTAGIRCATADPLDRGTGVGEE